MCLHDVRAEHVEVKSQNGTTWVNVGPVGLFAAPDDLVAIGNEIVRQAAAVKAAE